MVGDTIERVRAHLAQPGMTKTGLALAAGLSPNALRDVDQENWNPAAKTLLAIEAYLDAPADTAKAA